MRFYPTKIQMAFACFLLFSIVLILGCSKDSDLLLDSVIDDPISSIEEKDKNETSPVPETTVVEEVTVTEPAPQEISLESRTSSFSPTNDAHVQSGKGYNQNIIRLDEGNRTSYLMFDLSPIAAINGTITKVILQFTVDSDNGSGNVLVFKANSSSWSENNLTEANIPQIEVQIGSLVKEYKLGATEYVELNTAEVQSEVSTFILNLKDGNDFAFASKEHDSKIGPKLVVLYDVEEGAEQITIPEIVEETTPQETVGNEEPIAVADATPSSGGAPLEVSFAGSNSSDDEAITSYSWDFKDGSSATTANPTHTYTNTGSYEAVLTVTDAEGLTTSDTVTINVSDEQNQAPKAIVSATPTIGSAPLAVSFKGSASTDDHLISSYNWDFKDGSKTNVADFTHTYTQPGTYEAELKVTDENGLSNTNTISITVTEAENQAPVAIATVSATSGVAPLALQFTGDKSTDDKSITKYAWDFKDGSTASTANAAHTFDTAGSYAVELTVEDAEGLSHKRTIGIIVSETQQNKAPVAIATVSATSGVAPLALQFTGDKSTDDNRITKYTWDFKDGSTASTANTAHTFDTAGSYAVELTVEDAEGLSHKRTIGITVSEPQQNQPPVAVLSANPTSGTAPLAVQFLGNSSTDDEAITSYFWDFKDGNTSTSASPSHTFNQAGNYSVDLTVKDADGASNTKSITISVSAPVVSTPPGFYVATNGNASNNGQSPSSPWSLEHAVTRARSGDIVYVKAGNYGKKNLIFYNSGNSGSPIKFIGYTNTPGDLVSNQGSTFKYGDALNANKMPLLYGNSNTQGIGLDINGGNIEIHNFQITNYQLGINTKGANVILKNMIVTNIGAQNNNSSQTGKGIQIYGNNTTLQDGFILNSNSEGVNIKGGSNCMVKNTQVYSDNASNPTGYYILISDNGKNNIIEKCTVYRNPSSTLHLGHGITIKDQGSGNRITGCKAYNTGFEVNFSGVTNNTFENSQIYGRESSFPNQYSSVIAIMNGASYNKFTNIYIEDTGAAIKFHDFDDGFVGAGGDKQEGGHNNIFTNIEVNKSKYAVTATSQQVGAAAFSRNNEFKNCDFKNITEVPFYSYQTVSNTKFTGCNFTNIPSNNLKTEFNGGTFDATFTNCNFSNVGFPIPN